eukprot:TRINITY_DN797_c0_g1_i22.p1 TRINITY_DN797_c0_g1~~TRINITY_DN797_c0_g1_i22.p1  ORF type:complete len:247 (+),score=46.20 TRINITY_DN797_c0_g1_i22:73-813(+)
MCIRDSFLFSQISQYLSFVNLVEKRPLFAITKLRGARTADIDKDTEVVGRWTKAEHQKFLEAFKLHGRNWKLVCKHVGTRSATQARSHAQKFFAKMQMGPADSRMQETTVGSPAYSPNCEKVAGSGKESGGLRRKLKFLVNPGTESFNKTDLISIEQENVEPGQALGFPATVGSQKASLSEQYLSFDLDVTPLIYESSINKAEETEGMDYQVDFFGSGQMECRNEETEYPMPSLASKYSTLRSIFD